MKPHSSKSLVSNFVLLIYRNVNLEKDICASDTTCAISNSARSPNGFMFDAIDGLAEFTLSSFHFIPHFVWFKLF